MIRKSGNRFSEKIMLKQKAGRCRVANAVREGKNLPITPSDAAITRSQVVVSEGQGKGVAARNLSTRCTSRSKTMRHVQFRRNFLAMIGGIVDALRQDHRLVVHLAIGEWRQQMRNAVEPGALLVDGLDHPPRRLSDVGA